MTIITISGKIYVAYSGTPPYWALDAIAKARAGTTDYAIVDNAPDAEYYEGDDISDWDFTTGTRLNPRVIPEPVLTEEEKLKRELDTLTSYLSSTDWYAIRFAETGEEIPVEVSEKRQWARNRISEIRLDITEARQ